MSKALLIRVWHLQMLDDPLSKSPTSIPTKLEFGFHPANHHGLKLGAVRHDSRKSLVVEKFEQRGEALSVAVMRCSGEEEFVFEVGSQRPDGLSAHGVRSVFASPRR